MELPKFDWGDEFEEYLESLTSEENSKMIAMIKAIQENGLQVASRKKWIDKLDKNLYEIRTQTNEVFLRGIYFQVKGNEYWVTHGFNKKKNKTPSKEIARGKSLRRKYQDREGK
ncbi:type II toxin-antitoxin system RelE/ParE family toxin [Candidatus Enterococcus courvalinii]|uniref:Type II toxin-antitoxin system RelE/ParE family toxin n=1 Tax=Candidatus Enterococcus courvalinii TaxID=2815329 RepID=A0ABS3HYK2_9ENTE|nr:type II toxin-antitoxin system RelE/ParE family toxin [Enterococcus sp. MSG2901]MBO0481535.1 type II toxin-antitoxin system RelE/ParE family toxin [Enterococcus sp. MSG2901]